MNRHWFTRDRVIVAVLGSAVVSLTIALTVETI
jgi:hypothetical protein